MPLIFCNRALTLPFRLGGGPLAALLCLCDSPLALPGRIGLLAPEIPNEPDQKKN
jgi:hypothetical protein